MAVNSLSCADVPLSNYSLTLLNHLVRCCQLGCSACLARWSFQVQVRSCARHRHIPYERPARTPRNQCQPIWAFSVWTTKTRWFLRNRDAGWGKRSCYDVIEMVVPYSSTQSSFTYKTVLAKRVDLCSTAALVGNSFRAASVISSVLKQEHGKIFTILG